MFAQVSAEIEASIAVDVRQQWNVKSSTGSVQAIPYRSIIISLVAPDELDAVSLFVRILFPLN